jgi:hypothetical protein
MWGTSGTSPKPASGVPRSYSHLTARLGHLSCWPLLANSAEALIDAIILSAAAKHARLRLPQIAYDRCRSRHLGTN